MQHREMKLYLWLVLSVLTSCAVGGKPYVHLQIEGDENFVAAVVKGANAWAALGYVAGTEPSLDGFETVVNVRSASEEQLRVISDGDGYLLGVTEPDRINLLNTLAGIKLQHTAAHEIGHALFGPNHLNVAAYKGIMYYQATEFLSPTENDYELVCKESGDCL